jgi:hypothetical protein
MLARSLAGALVNLTITNPAEAAPAGPFHPAAGVLP